MANPLTGDFDAVLQISGSTINRLLASMHQNAFENPKLPSFPHSVRMRIGDDHAYEGVRGLAHVQISVPRIELVHGATDRFILEVWVRGWYRPDPGTKPLPTYINGMVRAEYRLHDIDSSCPGYAKNAGDFLWFRVVRDSVQFRGTVADDIGFSDMVELQGDAAATEAENIAKVTRQVARLLAKRFEATPHPVSKRFRRGSMRSLNNQGGAAVALPLGLQGDPWGSVNSIDNVLLNGADLAVGVNVNYLMSVAQKAVQPFASFALTVPVHIGTPWPAPDIDTVYHVGVHPPAVEWIPHGNYAVFKIRINGWATTNSVLPNATFDIEQDIVLNFGGSLWLSPGSLKVTVHASGIYSGTMANAVQTAITKLVPPMVQNACNNASPSVNGLTQQTGELADRLKSLDPSPSVWIDSAEFTFDGMILRGGIGLSARRHPVIQHEVTAAGDAHSALQTWIPGGRIDRFEWSWTWAGSGETGAKVHADRFLLRRPKAKKSRWGVAVGLTDPLPGLDGWGQVCLRVIGVVVNPVTGQFETVVTTRRCVRFGLRLITMFDDNRLYLRDVPELSQDVPFPQLKERALVATRRSGDSGANTLVLYAGEEWSDEAANALGHGLDACRRYDAGLSVLVLFKEGVLDRHGPRLAKKIERQIGKFGILGHVNEDVDGGWVKSLRLQGDSGGPGWALISPEGTVPWSHQGRIEAKDLGAVLDTHLRRSADMKPSAHYYAIGAGQAIGAGALSIGDMIDAIESPCPPVPLGRFGSDTVVTFVQANSEASIAHLRQLASQGAPEGRSAPNVIAVVDHASLRDVQALKEELGLDFALLPDAKGILTDRFRVDVWPTTITVNSDNVVSDVQVGVSRRGGDHAYRGEGRQDQSDAAV